jgi:hypothetical protein
MAVSDDWKVGDLAVCVVTGALPCPHDSIPGMLHRGGWCPKDERAREVVAISESSVNQGAHIGEMCGCISLTFADGSRANSSRCRKIRPDELTECEPEFVTFLKRRKVSA